MNELIEELKRIHEHFKEIRSSPEKLKQFEKDIIECGYGRIKPGPLAMDDVITEDDMWIYKVGSNKPLIIKIDMNEEIVGNLKAIICTNTNDDEGYVLMDMEQCNINYPDYNFNIMESSKNTTWRQDNGCTALCS